MPLPRARAIYVALLILAVAAQSTATATAAPPAKPSPAPAKPATSPAKPAPVKAAPAPAPSQADAMSAAIVKDLTNAMGGQETWDKLPYFRFDFVVVRDGKEVARFQHWWDKRNGRCRVEGPDDQGRTVTAIFNLSDLKGKSFTEGIVDTDSSNIAAIIRNGYERWVNDTYWLIMPFKLRDPGTQLKYARADQTASGETCDVLELSFGPGVGLTPKDRYWLFVNRKTHLIDRWEFVLQGQQPPPQGSAWEAWSGVGPLQLSLMRRFKGSQTMLRFENVATPATMDESVFTFARPKG